MKEFRININAKISEFHNVSTLHRKKYYDKYSGVYVMYDNNNEVLYVGKTIDLARRMNGHKRDSDFYRGIKRLELYNVSDMYEMELLETIIINDLKPRHNKGKVYFRSTDYSESISVIDYEIQDLKQEIKYLEQDIDMISKDDDYFDFKYDYDGFSKESEIEPTKYEIEQLQDRISELQAEKHVLTMRLN